MINVLINTGFKIVLQGNIMALQGINQVPETSL